MVDAEWTVKGKGDPDASEPVRIRSVSYSDGSNGAVNENNLADDGDPFDKEDPVDDGLDSTSDPVKESNPINDGNHDDGVVSN